MQSVYVRCPKCIWEPDGSAYWKCSDCKTVWNTFETAAKCPTCARQYEVTLCPPRRGGCGQINVHKDWYVNYIQPKQPPSSLAFWKKHIQYPVSIDDKAWIELSLLWLIEKFQPDYFRSLNAIIPQRLYSRYDFKNSEEDAEFLLAEIGQMVGIDVSEIKLVYLSDVSIEMPEEELTAIALESTGDEESKPNFDPVPNVLWISVYWLNDVDMLVVSLAQKLIRRKILMELKTGNINGAVVALAMVAFGFGIFMGNTYYRSGQWETDNHSDWRRKKYGYPPEQVIAYAMAWLTHYRHEDTSWRKYLDKTILKDFEQSYQYIDEHLDEINW
jgi:hypothetical protein